MDSATIIAALGAAGVPFIIVGLLELVKTFVGKSHKSLPANTYNVLAIMLGVAAAVAYQLYEHGLVGLPVAFVVGSALGGSAMKIYDGIKGSVANSLLNDILPIIQSIVQSEIKKQSAPVIPPVTPTGMKMI